MIYSIFFILLQYLFYCTPILLLGMLIYRQKKGGGAIIPEKERQKIASRNTDCLSERDKEIVEFYRNEKKVKRLNNILVVIFGIILLFFSIVAIWLMIDFTISVI